MTLLELLATLREHDAELELVDGEVRVVNAGALPDEAVHEVATRQHELASLLRDDPVADGRAILAALAARGISVRLDDDGRLRAGPASLIDETDRALFVAHRNEVVAALRADVPSTADDAA